MTLLVNTTNVSFAPSSGNVVTAEGELLPVAAQIVLTLIIGTITIIGVPSNLLVIYIFSKIYRNSPTTINLMIVSITTTDFMLYTFGGPVHTVSYILGKWYLRTLRMPVLRIWVHFCSVASLSHLVVISIERYLVVKYNVKKDQRAFWKQLLLVSTAWLYAIFWAILPFFGWSSYELEGVHTGCAPKWVSREIIDTTYNITLIFTEFIFPLMVIVWAYWKLIRKIKEHNAHISVTNSSEQALIRGRMIMKSTTRLIVLMVGAYTFSWLPYSAICVWAMLVQKRDFPPLAAAVPALFAKSSVIWNPLIYGMKHAGFRNELAKLWERLRSKSQVRPNDKPKKPKVEFQEDEE
uniref:C-like opsin n=1 Tax=Tripedalia cystophora TaxID=6141 RepID=A0A059NTD4_TRICY|nr:c-like opsin [Tripedalia cystophora]